MDLALNYLQRLICHKTLQTKSNRNGLCDVSSASFLCQLETVFFREINRHSKYVVNVAKSGQLTG